MRGTILRFVFNSQQGSIAKLYTEFVVLMKDLVQKVSSDLDDDAIPKRSPQRVPLRDRRLHPAGL